MARYPDTFTEKDPENSRVAGGWQKTK